MLPICFNVLNVARCTVDASIMPESKNVGGSIYYSTNEM